MGIDDEKLFKEIILQRNLEKLLAANLTSYFVLEKKPKKSIDFFKFFLNIPGYFGVLVTPHGESEFKKMGLSPEHVALIIKFTRILHKHVQIVEIDPESLGTWTKTILGYMQKHDDKGFVIFLEGIESLIVHRGINDVINIICAINDALIERKQVGKLIISISKEAIGTKHLALLERSLPDSHTFDFEK